MAICPRCGGDAGKTAKAQREHQCAPLQVAPQPYQLTELSSVEQTVNELTRRYDGVVYDVTTPAGMAAAKKDHGELRSINARLEEAHKKDKAFYWEGCLIADAKKRQLVEVINKYKLPLAATIDAENQRVERERADKIRAENERRQGIQLKIQKFRAVAQAMVNKTSAEIEEVLGKVKLAVVDSETYAEWIGEATQARLDAVVALESLLIDVREREAEQARIAADRARLKELEDRIAAEEVRKNGIHALIRELREWYITPQMDSEDVAVMRNSIASQKLDPAKYQEFIGEAQEALDKTVAELDREIDALKTKENQAAEQKRLDDERREQDQKQADLDVQQRELDRQTAAQQEQNRLAAERVKALSKARRPTPEKALADILVVCRGTAESAWKLMEIELIAEASLPQEKAVVKKGTKSATARA